MTIFPKIPRLNLKSPVSVYERLVLNQATSEKDF